MASSITFQQSQLQLSLFTHCKSSPSLNSFKFYPPCFLPTKDTCELRIPPSLEVKAARVAINTSTRLSSDRDHEKQRNNTATSSSDEFNSGFASFSSMDKRVTNQASFEKNFDASLEEHVENRVVLRDRYAKNGLNSRKRRENGSRMSSTRFRDKSLGENSDTTKNSKAINMKMDKKLRRGENGQVGVEKRDKGSKKSKVDTPETTLRVGLDMCSKRGDVMGAIRLHELAKKEGIKMGQYHYAVLLYLCSSAAAGIVQPAKSGSGTRSLSPIDRSVKDCSVGDEARGGFGEIVNGNSGEVEPELDYSRKKVAVEHLDRDEINVNGFAAEVAGNHLGSSFDQEADLGNFVNGSSEMRGRTMESMVQLMKKNAQSAKVKYQRDELAAVEIQVSEDVKKFALQKGFEIYDEMRKEKIPMNEATFTSVARMALALGDGDMAFDMVKQMQEYSINPRLRSYGPALSVFCNTGDVEKAFMVEKHMLDHGVHPEEPELEALLKASVEAGKSDKVYYLLHKLRTSVRQVTPATANLVERWFRSKVASRVGKRKWDKKVIAQAIENGGGGWHGQGWLGKGKWTVSRAPVGSDGCCKCCGEKLVTIDLDPEETENFAKSVASIAAQREKHSSFQKFQKWLDYYGPFEAVVDGANVGLYSQRRFKPSKVNAVVNGIRQMLPSRKWPLIILHNRRITGEKMDEPVNKALIEKWKNADAIYATPTGSNDDWYWLYAAIKFRCLLVTNDEMRDHLFQLLGNDFFPRWKERHQVHFSFSETGPVFHMPPPCSVVIQETEKGHWHIPIVSEFEHEDQRTWLCITRGNSSPLGQDSESSDEESDLPHHKKEDENLITPVGGHDKLRKHSNDADSKRAPQEVQSNLKTISTSSLLPSRNSIIPQLDAAEKLGGCVIDFHI